jgi:hypothetical protein
VLTAVSELQGEELAALTRQLEAIAGTDTGDTDTGVLVDDYQVSLITLHLIHEAMNSKKPTLQQKF